MASEMSTHIGARIRQGRRELDINQRELAIKINEAAAEAGLIETPIDNQRVSDWERGVNKPSERYMSLLSAALNRPVSWFWESGDEKEKKETPDLFGESQLDRVERSLGLIHDELRAQRARLDAVLKNVTQEDLTAQLEDEVPVPNVHASLAELLSYEAPQRAGGTRGRQGSRRPA